MNLRLALGLGGAAGGGLPVLKFAGAGGRVPNAPQPAKTLSTLFAAGDFAFRMPQTSVPITELYFFFPTFYAPTGGEIDTPGFTVEGMALRNIATGARTLGQINDGAASVVIPAGSATSPGAWIKFTPPAPLASGSIQLFTVAQAFANNAVMGLTTWKPVTNRLSLFNGDNRLVLLNSESAQGAGTSQLSTLSTSSTFNNTGGDIVRPSHMLCRMASGEVSVVMAGDSILADNWNFAETALDDAVQSARIACGSFAVAGWGYIDTNTGNSHANATAAARQFKIIEQARALNGGRPVCDHFFSNHGTNSSTDTIANQRRSFRTLHSAWKAALGCTQSSHSEMLPFPQSTDGYNTLANQTVAAAHDYPTGQRWLMNEDIGGPDGLAVPTAAFRADGTIIDSFAPWRISGANLTTQRDLLSVRAFNTTLAAPFPGSGSTLSLVAAPTVGDMLSINNGATFGSVVSVTGTGPFTATMVFNFGGGVSAPSGANVRSCWADSTGLHPSALAHFAYAFSATDSALAWKVRRGWVPPLSAPAFSGVTGPTTAKNGDTVAYTYTLTGFPAPTITVQPQVNGVNAGSSFAGGPTGFSYTINAGAIGLDDGETLSFEVTATNSQGTATVEPSLVFDGEPAVAAFLALIAGNANAGFYDFTDATAPGGIFTALDRNGGASFVSSASFLSPGINTTTGAVFNATSNRLIQRAIANGTYDVAVPYTRDVGNAAARMMDNTSVAVYEDGNATAVSPTIEVNGVSVATRNDFHDALTAGTERIIFFQGLSITGALLLLGSTSFAPLGTMRRAAFYPAANRATHKAAAIAAVQAS